MKKKKIEALLPVMPNRDGKRFSVQAFADGDTSILVMDYWKDKVWKGRYCMDTGSGEYQAYFPEEEKWRQNKLAVLCTGESGWWYRWHEECKKTGFSREEDKALAEELLFSKRGNPWHHTVFQMIDTMESDYLRDKREEKEARRKDRIRALMDEVSLFSDDICQWMLDAIGPQDYLFYHKAEKRWFCSLCGSESTDKELVDAVEQGEREEGKKEEKEEEARKEGKKARDRKRRKILHNDAVICPKCRKKMTAKKKGEPKVKGRIYVFQEMDKEKSVIRCVDVRITWSGGKYLFLSEAVRIILHRNPEGREKPVRVYWNQICREDDLSFWGEPVFDDKHNPASRTVGEGLVYPGGIEKALAGTVCEEWGSLFAQMARAGVTLDYCRLLLSSGHGLCPMTEYLFKGRFFTLLRESVMQISDWSGDYWGPLICNGTTEKEVFGIADKQKINRIRQRNGGELMVEWMRWSETNGEKVDDETLSWLEKEKITTKVLRFIEGKMSPRQAMNYLIRQQKEEYPKIKAKEVAGQWADYLSMCAAAGKDTADALVYRPRQLKRRHDEMVEEVRRRRMLEEMKRNQKEQEEYARRMAERFPGAEENLHRVKEKFSYERGEYRIIVPDRLADIVAEGHALHHCAGATERYFERMMANETYICFLRKTADPDVPFYTIEVEPGGTIRQHRSLYDEEPGIEEIRGFLREWQKVVKQRMTKEDKELARESEIKRNKNLDELREKNNLRVLEGLMEDFMEAM